MLPQSVQQYVQLELAHYYRLSDPPDPVLARQALHDFVVYLALSQLAVVLFAAVFGYVGFRVYSFSQGPFRYFLGKGKQQAGADYPQT